MDDRDRYQAVHSVKDWHRIAFYLRNAKLGHIAWKLNAATQDRADTERLAIALEGDGIGILIPRYINISQPPIQLYPAQPALFTPGTSTTAAPTMSVSDAADAWIRARQRRSE
jgi:hypothetical protein